IEDDAGDEAAHGFAGAEQHLAIVAARLLGRCDIDVVEAFLDGSGGFVGGEQALARCDHSPGDLIEIVEIHRCLLQSAVSVRVKIDGSRAIPKKTSSKPALN